VVAKLRRLRTLFQARLSRRIVLWIFGSIIVIEAIILIPSVYRRERELLDYLKTIAMAEASGLLRPRSLPLDDPQQVLAQLQDLQTNPAVVGGVLYHRDGSRVGDFGEPPQLPAMPLDHQGRWDRHERSLQRYDARWPLPELQSQYDLIIRHDTTAVQQEIYAFIWRITGLVVIISVFVTGAMIIVLDATLIAPILKLRQDLLRAGEAIRRDRPPMPFESTGYRRADELRDVITAFEVMFQQVLDAIAERKQAETALRISEEKFEKAFRSSPNPVLLTRLSDGHVLEANDSFLQFLGITAADIVGTTTLDLGIWATEGDRRHHIQVLYDHRHLRNQEHRVRTPSGQERTVLYSAERIDIHGLDCILSVINDITERKQAEEALRESERRFRELVEQAADAVFVVDRNGTIVDVNQRACMNLGYSREELLVRTVHDIQVAVSRDRLQALWSTLTPSHPQTIQGVHRRKDGSTFPVEVRVGLFEFGDRRLIVALARDITERIQAEAARIRLAEIGELTAMIVHEVRNPLTTVWMGLHALAADDLSERSRLRLQLALEEAERLKRLLNEILLYAKDQRLDRQPLELNQFLADILDPLRKMPTVCDRQIQLQTTEPCWVEGDRDKLQQVVINLMTNACEAVSPQSTITCSLQSQADTVILQVHNGGDPIPPDLLDQLTQPFFTTKANGNGLGLAITRRILDAHHGSLHIASGAPHGTTVTVTLPRISSAGGLTD
jgi:PAS domain S-box-containing protein